MQNRLFLYLVAALLFQSCGGANYRYTQAPTAGALAQDRLYHEPPVTLTQSLFEEMDRTISEENIQKLLDGKLLLPDTLRIAVYKHGGTSARGVKFGYYRTDEEFLKTQQSFVDTIVSGLSKSTRVQKVTLLPTMLIPSNPTLTRLRESAVRVQADVLLVFAIQSDLYEKTKLISKDEIKAYATTEALLLDIRTGLIPFSTILTNDYLSKETRDDLNFAEQRARAERVAVHLTLARLTERLRAFLKQ